MSASLWGVTTLGWVVVTFTDVTAGLLTTTTPVADWGVDVLVVRVPAMLVGDWLVVVAACAETILGVLTALTILTAVVVAGFAEARVVLLGVVLAVGLPDEIALTVFTELVGALLLAKVNVPPPEVFEIGDLVTLMAGVTTGLDVNVKTGAELLEPVPVPVARIVFAMLEAVVIGVATDTILACDSWGPMFTHGGPFTQPVITNLPLTKFRL